LIKTYFFDSSLFAGIGPILAARVKWLGAGDFVPLKVLSPSVPRNKRGFYQKPDIQKKHGC